MSFDHRCFEIGWDFILAGEKYRHMDLEKVPSEVQSQICGLFKQATFGDLTFEYADKSTGAILDNCRAWEGLKGISRSEAMKKYVKRCEEVYETYSK